MKHKIFAILFSAVLACFFAGGAGAYNGQNSQSKNFLIDLGILSSYKNDEKWDAEPILRHEAAALAVGMIGGQQAAGGSEKKLFQDVPLGSLNADFILNLDASRRRRFRNDCLQCRKGF